jgi:hypothetical protein
MLIKLLEENEVVHAHHVYLEHNKPRVDYETKAFLALQDKIKSKYKNLIITTSHQNNSGFYGMDYLNVAWHLFHVAESYFIQNHQMEIDLCFAEQIDTNFFSSTDYKRLIQIYNAYFSYLPYKPYLLFPLTITKKDIVKCLPKDYLDLCFYCWHPNEDGSECGKCVKCVRMNKIKQELGIYDT